MLGRLLAKEWCMRPHGSAAELEARRMKALDLIRQRVAGEGCGRSVGRDVDHRFDLEEQAGRQAGPHGQAAACAAVPFGRSAEAATACDLAQGCRCRWLPHRVVDDAPRGSGSARKVWHRVQPGPSRPYSAREHTVNPILRARLCWWLSIPF